MGLLRDAAKAAAVTWLGLDPYLPKPLASMIDLDTPTVDLIRRIQGGQLEQIAQTKTRWYLADLELAEHQADTGRIGLAAQLMRAARKDGVLLGVLSTRTDGLVRLPKRFRGDAEIIDDLEVGTDKPRSIFDEMLPPTELGILAADAELLGVACGELVAVPGQSFPLLVRHDPEFLYYYWSENQWYYRSIAGLIPITPGDGRWVLHFRGGRQAPWQHGMWKAVGQAWIRKQHAGNHKDNWEAKLANPARVATAPGAAAEEQKQEWFRAVMAWGINSVFGVGPGYDVKLLESNGRGWESFDKTAESSNNEFMIALAGQIVTTDGGVGFANADIHQSIRADLIKATADALAHTINTQVLPQYIEQVYGATDRSVVMEWDVTPPQDRTSEAQSLVTAANAISAIGAALLPYGLTPDVAQICTRFGIPVQGDLDGDGNPDIKVAVKPNLRLVENTQEGDKAAP
jgi:hypothetical protein